MNSLTIPNLIRRENTIGGRLAIAAALAAVSTLMLIIIFVPDVVTMEKIYGLTPTTSNLIAIGACICIGLSMMAIFGAIAWFAAPHREEAAVV